MQVVCWANKYDHCLISSFLIKAVRWLNNSTIRLSQVYVRFGLGQISLGLGQAGSGPLLVMSGFISTFIEVEMPRLEWNNSIVAM